MRLAMNRKITKRLVDAVQPGERDKFVWDRETKGFGLKVTPKGRRVYVLQTSLNGRLRRFTIGRHGSPWTPDGARKEALRRLVMITEGKDPADERLSTFGDMTISHLCDLYLQEGCEKKKSSTVAVETGLIERHIKPCLGKRPVSAVTRADVEKFMSDIAAGKTAADVKTGPRGRAIVTGGKGTANRTTDLLSSIMGFAVRREIRLDNPVRGVKKYAAIPRDRFLSRSEIAKLGEVLTRAEMSADPSTSENPYAIAALRLLMLTGCRKTEVLSLRWEWVDFDRALLRLPDSKTGAKVVHLGTPALELLQGLPRVEGNPHVIPSSRSGGHLVGLHRIWDRIRRRAGLEGVRIHDLRHSFASVAVSSGDSLYLVGKVLGHAKSRSTERYAHLADDPVKAVADRTSQEIAAALNGRNADRHHGSQLDKRS